MNYIANCLFCKHSILPAIPGGERNAKIIRDLKLNSNQWQLYMSTIICSMGCDIYSYMHVVYNYN